MDGVLTNVQQPYSFVPLPLKRALSSFHSGDVDCLWTFNSEFLAGAGVDVSNVIESQFIFHATQHIFTAPGLKPYSELSELKDKRVGIGVGSNLEARLNAVSANVIKLSNQDTKFRMLINNRLDAIGSWLPDLLILAHDDNIDPALFSHSIKMESSGVAFVCHPSEASKAFITEVDSVIDDYAHSAAFKDLFYRYGAESMYQGIAR